MNLLNNMTQLAETEIRLGVPRKESKMLDSLTDSMAVFTFRRTQSGPAKSGNSLSTFKHLLIVQRFCNIAVIFVL